MPEGILTLVLGMILAVVLFAHIKLSKKLKQIESEAHNANLKSNGAFMLIAAIARIQMMSDVLLKEEYKNSPKNIEYIQKLM